MRQPATAAHLADLLPRLPALRHLTLYDLRINSLAFLSRLQQRPVPSRLAVFELWYCAKIPLSELRHAHELRSLRQLRLYLSFTSPMDDHCRSLYTPPSPLMPQLGEFVFVFPQ